MIIPSVYNRVFYDVTITVEVLLWNYKIKNHKKIIRYKSCNQKSDVIYKFGLKDRAWQV